MFAGFTCDIAEWVCVRASGELGVLCSSGLAE